MGLLDRFRRREVVQTDDIWPFLKIPSRAKKIDTAQLTRLIRLSAVAYGNTNNENMVAGLKDLYKVFVSRVTPEARGELCADLHELITSGETSPTALLPFLDMDPDPTVTSTAAFGFSVLFPLKNDDPMTGPHEKTKSSERWVMLESSIRTPASLRAFGVLRSSYLRIS